MYIKDYPEKKYTGRFILNNKITPFLESPKFCLEKLTRYSNLWSKILYWSLPEELIA